MKKNTKHKKIIVLAGSGSAGPVTPLLAVAETLGTIMPEAEFVFVGTRNGIEQRLAKNAGLRYRAIQSGKLHRYWTVKNVIAPFQILIGFVQSYFLLRRLGADCVLGAGGFVQVPVMWAAWMLDIPVIVHQQDVVPGLANLLCAPIAQKVTVTFQSSLLDFPPGWVLRHLDEEADERLLWTGNPVRQLEVPKRETALKKFGLDAKYPTLLVMGGGTGSLALNQLVVATLPLLTRFLNIIHITGKGRGQVGQDGEHYRAYEFISDIALAYGACDMVLARAGLGTITELALIHRPAIIVPMPNSHQEANAALLAEKEAALVVEQGVLTPENLVSLVRGLLFEHALQKRLIKNMSELMPQDGALLVSDVVMHVVQSEQSVHRPSKSVFKAKHKVHK